MSDWTIALEDVLPKVPSDGSAGVHIAVVGQLNLPDQDEATYELLLSFTRTALQQLADLGADFTFIDVTADAEPDYESIVSADAVIMLGGGDVEATRYGHDGPVPNEYGVDPRSDARQLRVIAEAVAADQTMLAICRGSQLLNVASGGSLIPNLPDGEHRGLPGEPMFIDDVINIDPQSPLGEIYPGRKQLTVRNGHHQAVAGVGDHLRVIARAPDGIIEGTMRMDKRWIIGVQWHPEDPAGSAEDRAAIFAAVIDEIKRRQAEARA